MAFQPYLNFGGTARSAFTRYQEIFGGELTILGMDQAPASEGYVVPEGKEDLVMHAALVLPDGGLLMASDSDDAAFGPVQGMYVNHTVPDVAEGKRVFEALADGGKVDMPFEETFWTPGFGVCTDRFGSPWMVNVEHTAS